MAEGARDPDRLELGARDPPDQADDRVELDQLHRGGGTIQVARDEEVRRQCRGVHLETDGECGRRAHRRLDDLVQAQGVGPELLVAERVEPKDLLALTALALTAPPLRRLARDKRQDKQRY